MTNTQVQHHGERLPDEDDVALSVVPPSLDLRASSGFGPLDDFDPVESRWNECGNSAIDE